MTRQMTQMSMNLNSIFQTSYFQTKTAFLIAYIMLQVNQTTLPFFFGGGTVTSGAGGLSYSIAAAPQTPFFVLPLPAKSPGMLPDGAELFHAHSGILVDDQGHPDDLARLIEEVLELSHADPTLPESRGTPINLRGLIASVGRTIQQQNATRGVGLDVTLPPDLPSVLGDQARLRRVLTTLIARAIHVSEPGATVHVRASLGDAGGPEIVVEDSAPAGPESGFSDTDSWRSARSDVLSGVALGLPMMRHIVDLFGGTLLIEAAPTGGTIATIRLPAERVIR